MSNLFSLLTEQRNPASAHLDSVSTLELVRIMNNEDRGVPDAVAAQLEPIARAIDATAERLEQGGRLFYIGAGTSGRLGVLDASECPPTFSVSPELVQGIIAGGEPALSRATEASEDNPALGEQDLLARGLNGADVLTGIAASGRTPYVLGAMKKARELGALTIGIACSPDSPLAALADIPIEVLTGPEVVTGSTRMKAGTATKLVLNMLSTGVMVRLGYVYENLMVNVQPKNEKLVDRSIRIVQQATGLDRSAAERLFHQTRDVKVSILMAKLGVDADKARSLLAAARGRLRQALQS
ncbi:MAG TPA: N-acetylmuramic acid 6-phosphate etherase [Bryobacteraceae bacterium]|nr:N-acetylmuramic acid 6-phosphate etherase [Bryobacteraceae bacterium]